MLLGFKIHVTMFLVLGISQKVTFRRSVVKSSETFGLDIEAWFAVQPSVSENVFSVREALGLKLRTTIKNKNADS